MDIKSRTERNMQEMLLFGSVVLMCLQLFGAHSKILKFTVHLGYYTMIGALCAFIGYQACRWFVQGNLKKKAIQYSLCYYGLFVAAGVCRMWLNDEKPIVNSLVQVLVLRKIPKYTELFFAMALLAVLSIWIVPFVYGKLQYKKLWILVAAASIMITFLPDDLLGYPVLGMLFGTEVFRGLTLVAYSGCYLMGCALFKRHETERRLKLSETVVGAFVSFVIIYLNRRVLKHGMDFPLLYWEVLISFGLTAVCLYICERGKLKTLRASVVFASTGLMVVMAYILNIDVGIEKIGTKTMPFFCILLGLAAVSICMAVNWIVRELASLWKNKELGTRRYYLVYWFTYTVAFAVLMTIVFLPFRETQTVFLWCRDAISQYFPKAIFFSGNVREAVHNILTGSYTLKMYDFSLGMGDAVIWSLDPVYWLYAFFAPENMEAGYQFVTVLRFYMIGLSVSVLLFYLRKGRKITLFCSFIYVFSGYALYAVARHPQFAIPMVMLPLLIIAVEEILRHKKWHLGCALIVLSLLSNYYFLFMNTIALVVYFLVRFFCMEKTERTVRNFFTYLRIFTGAYILGAGMGSMTIFTSFMAYAGSERAGAGVMRTASPLFYETSWPMDVYMFFLTTGRSAGNWLKMGFVPLAYAALVLLFIKKGRKELKALLSICLLFILFPVAGYVMGGMGNVTNRWSYMLALVVTVGVAEMLPVIHEISRREIKLLLLSVLPYAVIAMGYRHYSNEYTLKALILLLITCMILVLSADIIGILNRKQMAAVLSVLLVVCLWVNGDTMYSLEEAGAVAEYTPKGGAMEAATGTAVRALQDYDDDSFYRVGEAYTSEYQICASTILNLNSIAYYNSTINGKIIDYNVSMGNLMSGLVEQRGFNNRTFMNALACVKYYGADRGTGAIGQESSYEYFNNGQSEKGVPYGYIYVGDREVAGQDYEIYENQYALPLGYTYSQTISRSEFEQYNAAEKQEIMLTHAVVEDEQETAEIQKIIKNLTVQKMKITDIDLGDCKIEDGKLYVQEGATMTLYFDGLANSETYLYLNGHVSDQPGDKDQLWFKLLSEADSYTGFLRSSRNTYGLDRDEYLMNTGYSKDGIHAISLRWSTEGSIDLNELAVYCQPMTQYGQYIDNLKEDVLENIRISDNKVTGTISLEQSKLFVLSIPYQNGWSAYVDGEKTDLKNVNIMYTGLELSPGEHTIELRFELPGVRYGMAVTAVSIVIFAVFLIADRIRRKKKKEA